MFAQYSRSALFAGLFSAALIVPAWSADAPEATTAPDQQVALAASPQSGPMLARESLATPTSTQSTVVLGEGQPTRSTGSLSIGRQYAARANVERRTYRQSLILGIGF